MKKQSKESHVAAESLTKKPKKLQSSHEANVKSIPKNSAAAEPALTNKKIATRLKKKSNIERDSKGIKKKKPSNFSTKKIEKLLKEPRINHDEIALHETDQWRIKKKIIHNVDRSAKGTKGAEQLGKKAVVKHRERNLDEKIQEEMKRRAAGKQFFYYKNLTPFRASIECEKIVNSCGKYGLGHKKKDAEEQRKPIETKKKISAERSKIGDKNAATNNVYVDGLKTIEKNLKEMFTPPQNFKDILQKKMDDKEIDVVFSRAESAKTRTAPAHQRIKSKMIAESSRETKKTGQKVDSKEKVASEQKIHRKSSKPLKKESSKEIKNASKNNVKAELSNDKVEKSSLHRRIFPIIEVSPGKFRENSAALARSSLPSQKKSEDSNNSYYSLESNKFF